jgi:hypothetical protein
MLISDGSVVILLLFTAATNGPIIHSADDTGVWPATVDDTAEENRRTRRKTCPRATI